MNKVNNYELQWNNPERTGLMNTIINLKDDQIAAFLNLVGLNISLSDIGTVVADIWEKGSQSGHLPILICEAKSKEVLLWRVGYFEKHNRIEGQ